MQEKKKKSTERVSEGQGEVVARHETFENWHNRAKRAMTACTNAGIWSLKKNRSWETHPQLRVWILSPAGERNTVLTQHVAWEVFMCWSRACMNYHHRTVAMNEKNDANWTTKIWRVHKTSLLFYTKEGIYSLPKNILLMKSWKKVSWFKIRTFLIEWTDLWN